MTTTFFAPPALISEDRLSLPPDEARHALRVLRHGPGDLVEVVDGAGCWYRVRLDSIAGEVAFGTIVERRREVGEPAYDLAIAFGMLKSQTRLETFVEKSVELGVSRLIPLETHRTERVRLRADRLERIGVAAMKQCGRSRLLRIASPVPFDRFLKEGAGGARILCHEGASGDQSIERVLDGRAYDELTIAIGPEGGFTEAEVDAASSAGFEIVSLGDRRLRAETAGITAAAAVMLRFGPR